jgi:acyl carrier protein
VVYLRDVYSPKKNEMGYMAAINSNKSYVEKILTKGSYIISNINSLNQTVISLQKKNIVEIEKVLERSHIKWKILDVPQPYHTDLLDSVRIKLENYLKKTNIKIKSPDIAFYSSVIKETVTKRNLTKNKIIKILSSQITTPVNFVKQIKDIQKKGYDNFIEIGPKNILSGFIKNILRGKCFVGHISDYLIINKAKDEIIHPNKKSGKLFSIVNKVIGKVTGYEIEKISLEDKFQEDLGIDSIKKAEIVFTVLDELEKPSNDDLNLSKIVKVGDVIKYVDNAKNYGEKITNNKTPNFKKYINYWKREDLINIEEVNKNPNIIINISQILNKPDEVILNIKKFLENNKRKEKDIIIIDNIKGFELKNTSFSLFKNKIDSELIDFIKFLKKFLNLNNILKINIVLVTKKENCFFVNGISSFLKSVKKENQEIFFKHVCFQDMPKKNVLVDKIRKELLDWSDIEILYKGKFRYVMSLKEVNNKEVNIDKKSVVIVFGGAKGITFSLIKKISKIHKPIIYIVGRSSYKNKIISENISKLIKDNKKIRYQTLDAQKYNLVRDIFNDVSKKHKKIDLVINGTGTEISELLIKKNVKNVKNELHNNILPAFNILKASSYFKPKKIINFSSISSRFGNGGQSVYSCSNEIINYLTKDYNNYSKSSFAMSINWPAWDNIGMTSNRIILQKLKESGVMLLNQNKAYDMFISELGSSRDIIYFFDMVNFPLYRFSLCNFRKMGPLMGNIKTDREFMFEKTFSLDKDSYLREHKIKSKSYLPVSVGIGMFMCIANLKFGNFFTLNNVKSHSPIIVDNKTKKVFLKFEENLIGLKTNIESNIKHLSCDIEKNDKIKTKKIGFNGFKYEVDMSSAYNNEVIYFGPKIRPLSKIFLDNKNSLVACVDINNLNLIIDSFPYGKLILLVESSFHALGFSNFIANRNIGLPESVSKISFDFNNEISDMLYVVPKFVRSDKNYIKGDVCVVNKYKQVIIELNGIKFRKVKTIIGRELNIKKMK